MNIKKYLLLLLVMFAPLSFAAPPADLLVVNDVAVSTDIQRNDMFTGNPVSAYSLSNFGWSNLVSFCGG